MSVAVRLATNYEKISRQGTATILLSKHLSCMVIDKLLIGMELARKRYLADFVSYLKRLEDNLCQIDHIRKLTALAMIESRLSIALKNEKN